MAQYHCLICHQCLPNKCKMTPVSVPKMSLYSVNAKKIQYKALYINATPEDWKRFLHGDEHPYCKNNETEGFRNNCCHMWTSILQHRLKPIMKVMRMASGRGQSHFNVTDLLGPFFENLDLVRFSFNVNGSNSFYPEYPQNPEATDKTSFIPVIIYHSVNKNHFRPTKMEKWETFYVPILL